MTTAKIHADSPYSDAEKAEDMRMIMLVLDDYTRNGIATMTESEKVSYLSASLLSAYQCFEASWAMSGSWDGLKRLCTK